MSMHHKWNAVSDWCIGMHSTGPTTAKCRVRSERGPSKTLAGAHLDGPTHATFTGSRSTTWLDSSSFRVGPATRPWGNQRGQDSFIAPTMSPVPFSSLTNGLKHASYSPMKSLPLMVAMSGQAPHRAWVSEPTTRVVLRKNGRPYNSLVLPTLVDPCSQDSPCRRPPE